MFFRAYSLIMFFRAYSLIKRVLLGIFFDWSYSLIKDVLFFRAYSLIKHVL